MAKATGIVTSKGFIDPHNNIIGEVVTIELPKGMRVIGTCSNCTEYPKPTRDLNCILKHGFEYEPAKLGCRNWKARKK